MKAYTTQPLNPYSLTINSLDDFGFRTYPTYSSTQVTIDDDKQGWNAKVSFKSGNVVNVKCKGYHVLIDGERLTYSDINRQVVESAGEPTSWTDLRENFKHLIPVYSPKH
jgi:hypothetical protein